MAQKRGGEEEEEETEVKLPICVPPQTLPTQLPAARSIGGASRAGEPVEKVRIVKRAREVSPRCSRWDCRKRVGLMGFRCRCGEVFCSEHRYSDRHDCCYDYKAAGREAIFRENPVVKAPKIARI